ncbi:MAG TPA: nucleotidyltransferase family protein [Elusimicrobiota bacterium]|nr:nucleotidyltransferase family protein [Elusimicrobiota bacterium]
MKALVLAGGKSHRLEIRYPSKNKCMIPVDGKPVIQYSFDSASGIGAVDEIVVVVGYRAEETINYFGNEYKGKRLKYILQAEQKGVVHAIGCAREALADRDFLFFLGDEILIGPRHQPMLDEFLKGDVFGLCGVAPAPEKEHIKKTYALKCDETGRILRLVEKPRTPFGNMMGTGNGVFKNGILDYIDFTPIHPARNEKEFPDLIQCVIDDNHRVDAFPVCSRYVNINEEEDLRMAETMLRSGEAG